MPAMYVEHTTQRVLVMEWVEGRRLRREGQNGNGPTPAELQEDLKLVEIGVQCSLEQARYCHACPNLPGSVNVEVCDLKYVPLSCF